MVGTAPATVTRSDSMSEQSAAGDRSRPGRTRVEPSRQLEYGSPHELAWNMGTIASSTSRLEIALASASPVASACRTELRWL